MSERDQVLEELLLNDSFISWVLYPTPALDQYWQQWQCEHPEGEVLVTEARRLVHQMRASGQPEPLHEQEVRHMWQTLQGRHTEARSNDAILEKTKWYWMAASVSVLLIFSIFLFTKISEPTVITHQTAYGETQYIDLPDSSSVLLNANSAITYQEDWLESPEREIKLTGEAFFDVHHTQDHRRFLVQTNTVTVEVVGTSFNILNRRDHTQVVLKEGEVVLRAEDSEVLPTDITMQPGELVEIDGTDYAQHPVNVEKYTAWTQNEHIFEGATLTEIAQLLENIYGLEVEIEDKSLLDKKFTGRINRGDLNSLFGQLEKVFQLSIEREQQLIIIK